MSAPYTRGPPAVATSVGPAAVRTSAWVHRVMTAVTDAAAAMNPAVTVSPAVASVEVYGTSVHGVLVLVVATSRPTGAVEPLMETFGSMSLKASGSDARAAANTYSRGPNQSRGHLTVRSVASINAMAAVMPVAVANPVAAVHSSNPVTAVNHASAMTVENSASAMTRMATVRPAAAVMPAVASVEPTQISVATVHGPVARVAVQMTTGRPTGAVEPLVETFGSMSLKASGPTRGANVRVVASPYSHGPNQSRGRLTVRSMASAVTTANPVAAVNHARAITAENSASVMTRMAASNR